MQIKGKNVNFHSQFSNAFADKVYSVYGIVLEFFLRKLDSHYERIVVKKALCN